MVFKHSEDVKERIAKSTKEYWLTHPHPRKGKAPWNKGKKGVQTAWNKGKILHHLSGENSSRWKGGLTSESEKIRKSAEYRAWRLAVYERDGWSCVCCGEVGGCLIAHHIKSARNYPDLIYDVRNGITLCKNCHNLTNNYAERAKQNPNA